jgi:hypothetical protein
MDISAADFPAVTAATSSEATIGWIGSAEYLQRHHIHPQMDNFQIVSTLSSQPIPVMILGQEIALPTLPRQQTSLSQQAKIAAIIPHKDCNCWLEAALLSLIAQTRPLDAIVVIDDGSAEVPEQICRKFPQVTLLKSPGGVGPYQIAQSLIEKTDYDAYLFQDSDDWSAPERVARLLNAAITCGAEIVGCQELRVDCMAKKFHPVLYPLDVQAALTVAPGHALLHPSSLVSRHALNVVGGFANGLLFGGDTEFLLRAIHQARVINIPYFGYFRRKREGSLTTSPETGLESPRRLHLLQTLKHRARIHQNCQHMMQPVDIQPLSRIPTISFSYCCGPRLA